MGATIKLTRNTYTGRPLEQLMDKIDNELQQQEKLLIAKGGKFDDEEKEIGVLGIAHYSALAAGDKITESAKGLIDSTINFFENVKQTALEKKRMTDEMSLMKARMAEMAKELENKKS
jgi:hypothetical protein